MIYPGQSRPNIVKGAHCVRVYDVEKASVGFKDRRLVCALENVESCLAVGTHSANPPRVER